MSDDFLSFQIKGIAEGLNRALGHKNNSSTSLNYQTISIANGLLEKKLQKYLDVYDFHLAEEFVRETLKNKDIPIKNKEQLINYFTSYLIHLPSSILDNQNLDIFSISQKKTTLLLLIKP